MPITPCSGVRISWLMFARNCDFARLEFSAWRSAAVVMALRRRRSSSIVLKAMPRRRSSIGTRPWNFGAATFSLPASTASAVAATWRTGRARYLASSQLSSAAAANAARATTVAMPSTSRACRRNSASGCGTMTPQPVSGTTV